MGVAKHPDLPRSAPHMGVNDSRDGAGTLIAPRRFGRHCCNRATCTAATTGVARHKRDCPKGGNLTGSIVGGEFSHINGSD